MPQSRVTLQVGIAGQRPVSRLVLPVGVEQEQQSNDIRVTLTQTIAGAYFDNYGRGIPTLTLTGTTGHDYHVGVGSFNGTPCTGFQAMKHLDRDIVDKFFVLSQGNSTPPSNVVMKITSEADQEVWSVIPIQPVEISRSDQNPLWYMFSLVVSVISSQTSDPASPGQKTKDPAMDAVGNPTSRALLSAAQVSAGAALATAQSQIGPRYYIVQSSTQTLWQIAQLYLPQGAPNAVVQEAVAEIVAANALGNPNLVWSGQRLLIPNPLP